MALTFGTRLGVYEVTAQIGEGGMGQVYRATDTKLKRQVAIKILPASLAADADRLARFQREAEVLASLNHPHIAAIYGLEETGGVSALVMELVDGEDLSQRIARGAIPSGEALPIAKQIAEALEAAHEQGIVHRDLKPANIRVRADGTVKVLDFGLAKAMDPAGPSSTNAMNSPTLSMHATRAGIILGTAAYMAPEQARGKTVDRRADIWAFGVVLFEMLTGQRAFRGDDVQDTFVAVMRDEPDWARLPATLPPAVSAFLKQCLRKDARQRVQAIGDVRLALEGAFDAILPEATGPGSRSTSAAMRAVPWVIAAFAVAAALLWAPWRRPPSLAVTRVTAAIGTDVSLFAGGSGVGDRVGAALAMSPDGGLLVFVGPKAGVLSVSQLYVRRLDQLKATPMSGTDGATSPFFSPDGQWIAFFADGRLKTIPVAGGVVLAVCNAPNNRGGTWADDGTIVFQPFATAGGRLMRVSSSGGEPQPLTTLSKDEVTQRWPQVLPGGRAVIFTSATTTGTYENASVVAQPLPDGPRKILVRGGVFAQYLTSGHLVYVHDNTLYAASFDSQRLEFTSEPAPVVEDIDASLGNGSAQFAVSNTGTLVYLPRSGEADAPILWVDRSGARKPLRRLPANWSNLRFSPDGQRLAMDINDGGQSDIWVYDWMRDAMTRLTRESGDHRIPVWTPDGSRVAFRWDEPGKPPGVSWRRADGGGDVQQLLTGPVWPGS